jgi:2-polyprenyl-3-methyl-5-hydroxy-6-metoxy-1,4-benzoquinol methylase
MKNDINEELPPAWERVIQKVNEATSGTKRLYQPIEHQYFKDWELTQICSDRLQTILDYVGDVSGKRILDIGFFYGYFCHKLAIRGAKVVGVEISPKKTEIASLLSECYGLPPENPEFIHRPYQEYLEELGAEFDVTLFMSSWHHDVREDAKSALEDLNLLSKHTDILLMDMAEDVIEENMRSQLSKEWSPRMILDHTDFTECMPLKGSHIHRRIMYAYR